MVYLRLQITSPTDTALTKKKKALQAAHEKSKEGLSIDVANKKDT